MTPRRAVSVVAVVAAALVVAVTVPVAAQVTFTEYSNGISAGSQPQSIVAGSDGALWFAEFNGAHIGRITTDSVVTEYSEGIMTWQAEIAAGPDGNLWFTLSGFDKIGRITTAGAVTSFSTGITAGGRPRSIAAGPDGALWFTELGGDRIGRITIAGAVTEFSTGISAGGLLYGITAGPDGALWFTEDGVDRIGRITTAGVVTEFSAGITPDAGLWGITAGPDGALWFTETDGRIGRITTAGAITEYSAGITWAASPRSIVAGPDGALWFTESNGNRIGRITTTGEVTEYSAGLTASSGPYGIAVGPDGAIWFTESNVARIGRATVPWLQNTRWIPAVIHKDVPSKNAKWRSDVAVLNRSASAANLTLTMYPTAGPVTRTTQVGASSQLILSDVGGWLGVTTDSGPLRVVSDQSFFLSGRTYNQVDQTHTYGQDYDGQEPSELLAAPQSAWLPQLVENAYFRTNIGITNAGSQLAAVTLALYDASGNRVWVDTREYAPGEFHQYQQPYLPFGGTANGYAKVTVSVGSGVVAYASVTDQATGDPTTINMKR